MQQRKPTIEDVARVAGVSRATVSRAMNNRPGASPDVRSRVDRAAAELGYQPNVAARALASGIANAVDLVLLGCEADATQVGVNPYYSRVIAGVMSAVASSDTQLRVHVLNPAAAADRLEDVARATTIGAVLVNAAPAQASWFHQQSGGRVVSLGATAPQVPAVEAENVDGAHNAITFLHSLGRRHIAAIHGPVRNTCSIGRRLGHLAAIRETGLPDLAGVGDFRRDLGFEATTRLLAQQPDLDAVFAACDLMAVGAIQALTLAGRRVPDDVCVIGFDDSIVAECTSPPLTTVRVPVESMAAAATRALISGDVSPYWRARFDVSIVVRQSC
jgi:DNA-binding LacI/PurR family transcriptional regulator